MSKFDIVEALQAIGKPATAEELRQWLTPRYPEAARGQYLDLTIDRMLSDGTLLFNEKTKTYKLNAKQDRFHIIEYENGSVKSSST